MSGSGLGMFLDRFGMVLEKMSDEVGKSKFSILSGSIVPESGRSKQLFLAGSRTKIPQNRKIKFLNIFPYIPYFPISLFPYYALGFVAYFFVLKSH